MIPLLLLVRHVINVQPSKQAAEFAAAAMPNLDLLHHLDAAPQAIVACGRALRAFVQTVVTSTTAAFEQSSGRYSHISVLFISRGPSVPPELLPQGRKE
jgi:hypothetical protein